MTTESPIWTPARHPLARFLRQLAAGTRPPSDGTWMRVTPWLQHLQGILTFPGHAILAVSYDLTEVELTDLGVDGHGGAHDPRVVTRLAKTGWIGPLETLFLGAGTGEQAGAAHLVSRPDLGKHPLAEQARRTGQDVQVMGRPEPDCQEIAVLSRGIAGLRQIAAEVPPDLRGHGRGVALLSAALRAVPENELVHVDVSPWNLPGLSTAARAGLQAVGTVQLFTDRPERAR